MEEYERKKFYQTHLKNISEIKNCRTPHLMSKYPSRLFNFTHGSTFLLPKKATLWNFSHDRDKQFRLSTRKKPLQQRQQENYNIQQENWRLGNRILHTPSCVNLRKYEQEYNYHKRFMKLHRKVKENKKVITYCISDIAFKGLSRNLGEQYTAFDITGEWKKDPQQLISGSIFEFRNIVLKVNRDEKLVLKIDGGGCSGVVKLEGEQRMVPIMNKKEIVGNLILQIT